MNFAKFLRTPFLQYTSRRLPLFIYALIWLKELTVFKTGVPIILKSLDWFLNGRELRHERVNGNKQVDVEYTGG